MASTIAIKRLTASDCTLFEAVFRKIGAGNQKGINLNADVLTGQFYPGLGVTAATTNNQIALAISVFGPAARAAHRLSRKIIKNAAYKNWRLNGEFIPGPPQEPSRYDNIQPGDLAIMVFRGDVAPNGMDLILVSQTDQADAALHAVLAPLLGNKSMIAVSPAEMAASARAAAIPQTHPAYIAAADPEFEAALEDAAQGGFEGVGKLLTNAGGRVVSGSDLAKAKAKAELTGQDGEGIVNGYLTRQLAAGHINGFKWTSDVNAVAPFDFETTTPDGQRTLIDAKATGGPFENAIHLSMAEVIEASGPVPYRIYRVYDLSEDGGKLRISNDIGSLSKMLKSIHETYMPPGIRVDSLSIATSAMTWSAEEYVARPDEDDVP